MHGLCSVLSLLSLSDVSALLSDLLSLLFAVCCLLSYVVDQVVGQAQSVRTV